MNAATGVLSTAISTTTSPDCALHSQQMLKELPFKYDLDGGGLEDNGPCGWWCPNQKSESRVVVRGLRALILVQCR